MIRQHTLASIGLTQAEVTLIQTIIRLSSEQAVGYWDWVMDVSDALRLDGLMVSGQEVVDGSTLAKAKHVLFIGEPVSPPQRAYQVMVRPIRADGIIRWMAENTEGLDRVTAQAEATSVESAPVAPAPAPQQPVVATAESASPSAAAAAAPAASSPAASAMPAPPASQAVASSGNGGGSGGNVNFSRTAAKLTRWPTSQLLQKDPGRIRMATLLAKRPLTAGTLAVMGGQSIVAAEQFLYDLLAAGLLQLQAPNGGLGSLPPVIEAPRRSEAPQEAAAHSTAQQLDTSLLDTLMAKRAQGGNTPVAQQPASRAAATPVSAARSFFRGLRQRFGL